MKMHGSVPKPIERISKEELRARHIARAQRRKDAEKREVDLLREQVKELEEQVADSIGTIVIQDSVQDGDKA
jgi:hypothetical protein